MNETQKSKSGWRIGRRILIGIAVLATLVAIFYTEENWRGRRAWENCKRELEAKGEILDWNKLNPPPVPDNQNFFAAPKMAEWFVGRTRPDFLKQLDTAITRSISSGTNVITTANAATDYLAWSDQFEPNFNLIREALKRPYARMEGDYSLAHQIPIPNFIMMRLLAQTLAQRAHCYLLLNHPDRALDELTLLNESRRLLLGEPTSKPMTLVAAMINVAVVGLYANIIAEGLQAHVWEEPQLAALQKQLEQTALAPFVALAFECEMVSSTRTLEIMPLPKYMAAFTSHETVWQKIKFARFLFVPHGWIYQNMALIAKLYSEAKEGFDSTDNAIFPKRYEDLIQKMNREIFRGDAWPCNFISAGIFPSSTKAWQTTAYNQTLANQAQIACALERYHLAHGDYPETLNALVPQVMENIPHDIIGGKPLQYHPKADGKFLLYSVGWNETDDGGVPGSSYSDTNGDWVWKN